MSTPEQRVAFANAHRGGHDIRLGLRFTRVDPDRVEAVVEIADHHLQPYGLVHGGVHASVIETICSTGAAVQAWEDGRGAVGLENHSSFLRAVRQGTLRAVAWPDHPGRRTQSWSAEIRDDRDRLVAVGRVRILLLEVGERVGDGLPVPRRSEA